VCPPTYLREEALDEAVIAALAAIDLSDEEVKLTTLIIADSMKQLTQTQAAMHETLRLQQDQVRLRLTKLTDLLVDGTIDKAVFDERRERLVLEQARIRERQAEIERDPASFVREIEKTVGLAKSPSLQYKTAPLEKKREMLKSLLSDFAASGKNVDITLALPFRLIAEREKLSEGGPCRGTCRTWEWILKKLLENFGMKEMALN
jgi:hypothetical protein